jgi:hypothetical protein
MGTLERHPFEQLAIGHVSGLRRRVRRCPGARAGRTGQRDGSPAGAQRRQRARKEATAVERAHLGAGIVGICATF